MRALLLLAAVFGGGSTLAADPPKPLKDAIEALNTKTAAGYFDQEGYRAPPLPKDKWPAPVTTDEVVAAIRCWDRKKSFCR